MRRISLAFYSNNRDISATSRAVHAEEQVPEGFAPTQGQETLPPVLLAIMEHVAPLAERLQVPRPVVRRIMVQMRRGQHHAGRSPGDVRRQSLGPGQAPNRPILAVAPHPALLILPAPVPEMQDDFAMRTPAVLAPSASSGEADHSRELGPVDRIEPAVLRPDWHVSPPPWPRLGMPGDADRGSRARLSVGPRPPRPSA